MRAGSQKGKPTAARKPNGQAAKLAANGGVKAKPAGVMMTSRRILGTILVGILAVQVVSPATVIILVAGMLPSVVAYIVDTEPSRRSAHCMAVLNMAGVLPVLATLWDRGATRAAATEIMLDPFMWLLMYGSAGIAVLLLTILPVMMEQLSTAAAEREIVRLEKQMQKLVEEWGSDVAHDAGRFMPAEQPAGAGDDEAAAPPSGTGRAASSPKGAAPGQRPSSPSAASRRRGPQSGVPARG